MVVNTRRRRARRWCAASVAAALAAAAAPSCEAKLHVPVCCSAFVPLLSSSSSPPQPLAHDRRRGAFAPRPPPPAAALRLAAASEQTADLLSPGRLVEYAPSSGGGGASSSSSPPSNTLGVIVEPDGKRNWKILMSSGRTASIPPKRIRHVVPRGRVFEAAAATGGGASADAARKALARHEEAASDALRDDVESGGETVREVYEMFLEDDAETVELTDLADLIAGDDSSVSCHATRAVLTSGAERFCFREAKKGGGGPGGAGREGCSYEPRPSDQVESLRAQARAEAEEEATWSELGERIDEACRGDHTRVFDLDAEAEEVQAALRAVERLGCLSNLSPEDAAKEERRAAERGATGSDDAGATIAVAKAFLKRLGRKSTPEAAYSLLVGTGAWDKHTNLDMIRLRIRTEFSDEVERAATDLINSPPPDVDAGDRLDLTHLPAFAIDEASTREIDDALSVEILDDDGEEGDGDGGGGSSGPMHARQRLWVHIADPTRHVKLGSTLDMEARRRASSLYLPTGTVPMFPMQLASGPLHLSPGETACALSVGIMLDADGGIDQSSTLIIKPSLVRTTRLTYDQVDRMLDPFSQCDDSVEENDCDVENDPATIESLRRLQWASERRLQWRKDGGSLESIGPYELPDMSIKVQPDPDEEDGYGVTVEARDRYVASRIVTELMLLANEAIATYGKEHDVPLPFRSQETEEVSDLELDSTPEGPCRSWLAIRSTLPSRISSDPLPHDGLGLDLYVQATSPVRRYADLALHYQLKAYLRGDDLPFPSPTAAAEGDTAAERKAAGGDSDIVRLAQDGGTNSRLIERPANDYWLGEFLRRRGTDPTTAVVLSADRWKDDVYKLLLPDLGAILTYRSSRPLQVGAELQMTSNTLMN